MRSAPVILMLAAASAFAQSSPIDEFNAATFADATGLRLPYRLLEPKPRAAGTRYPLVLQLHGSGAMGTDNRAQIGAFSNGWLTPDIRRDYAAFVVIPQFASRTVEYPDVADPSRLRSKSLPPLAAAIHLVEKLATDLPIDLSRIYVTGFSMGASGALQLMTQRPDLFAAAVAIAPVPPGTSGVPNTPILILHGDADTENPFAVSNAWAQQIKAQGADVEFRAYPGLAHELPPDVPNGTWWRQWLFSKRLRR